MKPIPAFVPCNGCTLCCQNFDVIILQPQHGDRFADYDCRPAQGLGWILRHQANGDCIYLDRERGCTIHDRRPSRCRGFDCRALAIMPAKERRNYIARGLLTQALVDRGVELLTQGETKRSESDTIDSEETKGGPL